MYVIHVLFNCSGIFVETRDYLRAHATVLRLAMCVCKCVGGEQVANSASPSRCNFGKQEGTGRGARGQGKELHSPRRKCTHAFLADSRIAIGVHELSPPVPPMAPLNGPLAMLLRST
ncbi:hypothetical protein JTB14_014915 [Gonioctena quinquepunctata]|nr:hypothetical protein JTB14_014915 [Gonioctena quinquepunctata]